MNHYLGHRAVIKGNRAIDVSYVTNEAKKYKQEFADYVREEVKKQGWNIELNKYQHFYVDAIFYFDKTRMDCNNYFKVMLDAITDTQMVWADDNVVCERVQRIYYDTGDPRVELTITPVEYIGIFDDMSQLEAFVTNCIECTRYSRNCSILRKAKEGKIQQEIVEGICERFKAKKCGQVKKKSV